MRAVIQVVKKASVSVNNKLISSINKGFYILIGIKQTDTEKDVDYIIKKILNLKLFDGFKSSVCDVNAEILCTSQFTLFAKTRKGAKPDFHLAMPARDAIKIYENFIRKLQSQYAHVYDGKFGEYMEISLVNDGPITIIVDSESKE